MDNKEEAVEEEYQVIEREPAPQIEDQSRTVPVKTYAEKEAVTHVCGANQGLSRYQSKRWRWKINDGYLSLGSAGRWESRFFLIDLDPQE